MKVLFLTYHFAPYNHIGAVRCVKTANHLTALGDRVEVVTAADQPFPTDLETDLDREAVHHLPCPHLDRLAAATGAPGNAQAGGLLARLRRLGMLRTAYGLYKSALWYPDNIARWRAPLLAAAREITQRARPDVILASGPPYTPLIAAAELSAETGIPWVCELRDLWVDNHNYRHPWVRRVFEVRLEERTLQSAAALVTVSPPLAGRLRARYASPTHVIPNGFEPDDYPPRSADYFDPAVLNLVYTGFIYRDKQDITPLLKALAQINAEQEEVRLHLYGRNMEETVARAHALGVAPYVVDHGTVPHREALAAQRNADALLLLSWNDPNESGVFTGKLFEYLGARRPILAVGTARNVANDLIVERRAGHVSGRVQEIVAVLRQLRHEMRDGGIADLPPAAGAGFTRREQAQKLRQVLLSAIGSTPPSGR